MFPFNEELYSLEGKELEFMKNQTGITDEDELKKHIIAVTKAAYEVFPYPCIRRYAFLALRLPSLPGYDRLIELGKERKNAVLLDIGCCFGNDVRIAAADGFPAKQIVATDLYGGYWTLGHKLYRSTPETFPAKFLAGDAFDPIHLAIAPPVYAVGPEPVPDLPSLTSLNPLHGHVAAIHTSSFFHLFNEEQQLHLARAMAGLLCPLPGSMIIGTHAGALETGFTTHDVGGGNDSAAGGSVSMFCHSAKSWTELWDGQVFEKDKVTVEAKTVQIQIGERLRHVLQWCVTRL
ncbi:uncharacterized protein TRAVEDRAFT_112609 [Trametes versicolor FP-101664 SS1]|uniref:uncharacterized protein n=1 Tax=Trametes versicolor (strain FP-101664) TaxID=717944 RepID=UPI0004623C9A|nr:uncharacterized protein TRAVEDRAFT_112609 [Trametes versicolor FP-101664 SS1]EIW62932.1 hypothetical protein TRAVEDRAFT_112609 [Trametes versicolor FP-101664 SS1]